MTCSELVVYSLMPQTLDRFADLRNRLIDDFKANCSGFVSAQTFQVREDQDQFVDLWTWESVEEATQAKQKFADLASAKPFMQCVNKVQWSGLVQPWEGGSGV